jgi:hypothetical protein
MCGGPSSTQKELQQEEADFYRNQIAAYNTAYKNFADIQAVLNKQFEPILAKGPGQFGYTPEEEAALRTESGEGTARYYDQAQRALQQRIAAQGGGTSNVNITSGGSQALQAELAAEGAAESSRENLGITTAGYDLGRQMWGNAITGEEALAAGWNPNAFSSSTVNAGNSAASMANTITQQQNSMWGSVFGALGGIAGGAAGNLNVGPFKSG